MKLVLDLPDGWSAQPRSGDGGGWYAAPPGSGGGTDEPAISLRASALITRPDNMRAWAAQVARSDVPTNTSLRTDDEHDGKTTLHWPVHVLLASLVGSDGHILQRRLFAFYTFLDYAAHATVVGTANAFDEHLDSVRATLMTGRADMARDEVVCLAELWR